MVVYLNCELKARDLDTRLLIAAHLLKAGHTVVVGQAWSILANARTAAKGVVVFATANAHQAKWMAKCKNNDHAVIAMDEECLALRDANIIRDDVAPAAVPSIDTFLFQDARQEQLLRAAYPALRGHITGSARLDLLQNYRHVYRAEAESLRQAGKYILFNTNFTMVNSTWGDVATVLGVAESAAGRADPSRRQMFDDYIAREINNRTLIRDLIAWAAREFQGTTRVIVRPHPAENADDWHGMAGVEIVAGSNALPWMLGAELMIHASSTTGLEAALMAVPCLNVGRAHPQLIVDALNCRAEALPDAKSAIGAFLRDRTGPIATFAPPLGSYVPFGAKAVAEAIIAAAAAFPAAPPIKRWRSKVRTDVQKRKFTVSTEEFLAKAQAICSPLVSGKLSISPLDDSLFMVAEIKTV